MLSRTTATGNCNVNAINVSICFNKSRFHFQPGYGAPGGYPPASGGYAQPTQPGGYAPPSGGGYVSPPTGIPGVSPETQRLFGMVDRDRSGKISADELKTALVNGKGENFSDVACKLMIGNVLHFIDTIDTNILDVFRVGMFNRDKTGTVDIHEFEKLFAYINQWLAVFKTYDRDASGHIDESELTQGKNEKFST